MEFKTLKQQFSLSEITCYVIVFSFVSARTYGSSVGTTQHNTSTQYSGSSDNIHQSTTENLDEFYETDFLKLGTDYCAEKYVCSDTSFQTFPDINCHCDPLCQVLDDCCWNRGHEEYGTKSDLKKEQFSCVPLHEIIKNPDFGVTMVTKCSSAWQHAATRRLCEDTPTSDDIFLSLPVSDDSDLHVMYKNMYCAQCNFVYTFEYWKPQIMCINETGVRSVPGMTDCDWFYIRPRPEVAHRICQLHPHVIDTCSSSSDAEQKELNVNCTHGMYGVVYDSPGNAYRNRYCAECNGIHTDLYCEQIHPFISPTMQTSKPKTVYSFRLLVDFNKGTMSQNDVTSNLQKCNDNEKYDSFAKKCREIFCAPPSLAIDGSCVLKKESNESDISTVNCTLVKLEPPEYKLMNTSLLFLFSNNKTYNWEEFQVVGTDVFICLRNMQECLHDCSKSDHLLRFDVVESYLTLIGLILSIVSLAVTLTVYIMFPQLLNTPGKILLCLIISLLLAQLLFLISAEFEHISRLCISLAILVHYFFLAAFCWMNVMAFDMWKTFSQKTVSYMTSRRRKRFLKYNLYAWTTPLLIVGSAVVLDFVTFDEKYESLKPGYGKNVCWFSSKNALLLFFAGPLAFFKFFDVVSFIFTAVHIARAKRQGAMATRKNTCSFFINLKLSLIMGLTWVFAFVANFLNVASTWYLFIIFNSLQGFYIAICFLCTKKVGRLLCERCQRYSTKSSSGTQLSSLS